MRSIRLSLLISAALAAAACGGGGGSGSAPSGSSDNTMDNDAGNSSGSSDDSGSSPDSSSSGQGTDDGGGLAPPDLSAVCPDTNPTNITFATSQALPLTASGLARIGAGVVQDTDSWFSFVAPKSDPANVSVSYTADLGATTQLELDVFDTTDNDIVDDHSTRTGQTQTLDTNFETTANETYAVRVESNDPVCEAFDLYVHALACTDPYEDNDTFMTAAPITLATTAYAAPTTWATATANISATVEENDDDWYAVTAPLSDPMSVSVTYTRPAGDTDNLQLDVFDPTDNDIVDDHSTRTNATQTLDTVWEGVKGSVYRVRVESSTDAICADYTTLFNGLWCTDNFEDNDTFATAATLPAATATPATIETDDEDWYLLTTPSANGSCTVTYTVPTGSVQQLQLDVFDSGDSDIVDDHSSRQGASQTLTAAWTSTDAPYAVRVEASQQECTSYTITCN